MKIQTTLLIAAAAALSIITAGCQSDQFAGTTYSRGEARTGGSWVMATIVGIDEVQIEGTQSGAGAVGGGLLGGIAGHSIGGGHGKALATVAGAGAGALAGNAIEGAVTKVKAWRIAVQYPDGRGEDIVQAPGKDTFQIGQAVRVSTTRNTKTGEVLKRVEPAPQIAPVTSAPVDPSKNAPAPAIQFF